MSLFHAITIGILIALTPYLDRSLHPAAWTLLDDKQEETILTLDQPDQVWISQFETHQIRLNY